MKTRNYELAANACWQAVLEATPGTERFARQYQFFELYTEKLAMAQRPDLYKGLKK